MKRIEARARILNSSQAPAAGVDVRLQIFALPDGAWRDIGSGKTDSGGIVAVSASHVQQAAPAAPNLRLSRATDGAVLADSATLRFAPSTEVLSADFGEVAMLPEPVAPTVLMRGLRPSAFQVAAVAPNVAAAASPMVVAPQMNVLAMRATQLETENVQLRENAARFVVLERTNKELNDNVRRIPDLERQLAEKTQLSDRLAVDVARVGVLETQLGQATRDNAALRGEAERARQLDKQLGDAQREIGKLRAPAERTLSVATIATELGNQIGQAQEEIRRQPGSIALASVKVRMKGIMDGPARVTLPAKEDLARPEMAGQLTDVDLSFAAAPAAPTPMEDVQVPDVRRLTEGVVRQVLHSLGLRLTVVQGPAQSGGVAPGQAALQSPSAGERAKRGSSVTVVFAS